MSQKTTKSMFRILVAAIVWLALGIAIFAATTLPALAGLQSILQTTVADFNGGSFYRTGLTLSSAGGGDGNGEVRLQTVGISPSSWYSTGNVNGLPALYGHAAAYYNGRIYVSGGSDLSNANGHWDVYTTTINTSNHNLYDWQHSSNTLPMSVTNHAMVAVNGYLYVIGGFTPSSPFTGTNTVYFSQIQLNGTLGAWNSTATLPDGRGNFAAVVISNTIYVLGGTKNGSDNYDTIFYAAPNSSNGTIASWQTSTTTLKRLTQSHTAATYGGAAYALGGTNGSQFFPWVDYDVSSGSGVFTATQFVSTTNLQQSRLYASGVAFGGQVYVVGGATQQGAFAVNLISSNLIEPDHSITVTTWVDSPVLSVPRQQTAAIVSDDGWIYVIEGINNSNIPLNNIDYGPTSSTGSAYVPAGDYTSSVTNLGSSYQVTNINWNAMVSSTVTMTLQYRMGNTPDLSSVGWLTTSYATVSSSPVTNTIDTSAQPNAQYIQYRVHLGTNDTTQSPVLNAVQIVYNVPTYPDFAITGLTAPPAFSNPVTQTQIITYWVVDKNASSAPVRRAPVVASPKTPARSSGALKIPPPPTLAGSSPGRITAPQSTKPTYLFYVYFYADPIPVPGAPMSVTNALSCIDINNPRHDYTNGPFLPFIYYNPLMGTEIYKTPVNTFYAQCTVPKNTQNFWAQIDACSSGDADCTTNGYVLELDETSNPSSYTDNIKGPVPAGTSSGGGGGISGSLFLPYIKRSP